VRILGIDPGLARVGYGVIDEIEGKKKMLDCGIIETKSTQKEEKRLLEISRDLSLIIKKWTPKTAAVEKFFFYRSSSTISVVQARGVIIMTLAMHNLSILEFPPMQIKLAVTGYGHSNKNEVLQSVMRELNITTPPKPDDAADALAIALTGYFLQ
tara:strand:- start:770 stop:1234 length:465 start_codon:yes stop_codon:yes gene_type:complete